MDALARRVVRELKRRRAKLVLAESCTGGELASVLTRVPGVSEHLCGSLVVYRESAKRAWLGVKAETLRRHGAVSVECADEMARGALRANREATLSLAVTGFLGPGNSRDGLVFACVRRRDRKSGALLAMRILPEAKRTSSLRNRRRQIAVKACLELILVSLRSPQG